MLELPTFFLVSGIWFFSLWIFRPLMFLHIFAQLHIFPGCMTVKGIVHCSCTVFQLWSYPCFSCVIATAQPPHLWGSTRGISLVGLHSFDVLEKVAC